MIPTCKRCGFQISATWKPGGEWEYDFCPCCFKHKDIKVDMVEGTSLMFPRSDGVRSQRIADVSVYEYVEVSAELAARCRYHQDIALVKDIGIVAIFMDTLTGTFYGQPM
jgi:hypothetical protein